MPLEIILNKEPPKQLLYIIQQHYNDEALINKVTIDANNERIDKTALGGFFPDTKEVVIDLAHCVKDQGWMGFGMMMIQTVWFNMLRVVFHELGHALQSDRNPKIKDMAILTPQLEHEADSFATIMIQEWASNGGTIPKIDDMGWAGEQLKLIINTCYGNKELRPKILEELEVIEANGVAEFDTFTKYNNKLITDGSYDKICEDIDNSEIGINLNGKRYLNVTEFFELLTNKTGKEQEQLMTDMMYVAEEQPEENANKVLIDDVIKN